VIHLCGTGDGSMNSAVILHPFGLGPIGSLAEKEIEKRLASFKSVEKWKMLADFVEKHVIDTGRIKGVRKEQAREVVAKNKQIATCYLRYMFFSQIGENFVTIV